MKQIFLTSKRENAFSLILIGTAFRLVISTFFPSLLVKPKAADPIVFTLLGILIEVRLRQPSNEESPIVVTLLPIITELRLVQFLNVEASILVTLLEIVIELRLRQFSNVLFSIVFTPEKLKEFKLLQS